MNEWVSNHVMAAVVALILNGLFGGPRALHRKLGLNRPGLWFMRALHTAAAGSRQRGTVTAVLLIIAGIMAGGAITYGLRGVYWGGLVEIALLALLLSVRQAADFGQAVSMKIEEGNAQAARDELAGTPWRNTPLLDGHGICRAVIETGSVQFTDRTLSPLFWYLFLGLPGALTARLVTALSESTMHKREEFGFAAGRAAAALHYVPSLLATLLLALASPFLPSCNWQAALKNWVMHVADFSYRRRALAVTGAALNLALGGTLSVYAQGPWVGGIVPQATPGHVRTAVLLTWLASFLVLIGLALFPA